MEDADCITRSVITVLLHNKEGACRTPTSNVMQTVTVDNCDSLQTPAESGSDIAAEVKWKLIGRGDGLDYRTRK